MSKELPAIVDLVNTFRTTTFRDFEARLYRRASIRTLTVDMQPCSASAKHNPWKIDGNHAKATCDGPDAVVSACSQSARFLICCPAMRKEPKWQLLARWIDEELNNGIHAGGQVEAYMASTFGHCDLAHILSAADSSEASSLMELVFYPNTDFQVRYEDKWGRQSFAAQDREKVIAALTHAPLFIAVHLSGHAQPVCVQAPDFALTAFVNRLNIEWQPAAPLRQAVEHCFSEDLRTSALILLRNTHLSWHAHQTAFVCLYLEKSQGDEKERLQNLSFLLTIVPELSPQMSPFDLLTRKKRACFQALCGAEHFERKRLAGNMEILMLQGDRAAYGNMEQLRSDMRRIDDICTAVYGRTEFFHQPLEHHLTPETATDGPDLDDILRKLL